MSSFYRLDPLEFTGEAIIPSLFNSLSKAVAVRRQKHEATERFSRSHQCRCGTSVTFSDSQCRTCKSPLGYIPDPGTMGVIASLDPGPQSGTWHPADREQLYRFCENRGTPANCNWLVTADDLNPRCIACRLTRSIPDLDDADNARYWGLIESAKRRLVSQLLACNLPVKSRIDEDREHGLMFDFLRSPPNGPQVLTGHASGLITLNVEEADDSRREKVRHDMREPYRTLLGHFRHEVGHYYWDRLVWGTEWLVPFRQLFGDEQASYAEALKRNYEQGPPADWHDHFISSYASTHPWEDWAETWAHFLHLVDSLGLALGFGLYTSDLESTIQPFTRDDLYAPDHPAADHFLKMLNSWVEMTFILNELASSMGQPDFYPFVISRPVVAKLQFVQMIVVDAENSRN